MFKKILSNFCTDHGALAHSSDIELHALPSQPGAPELYFNEEKEHNYFHLKKYIKPCWGLVGQIT